MVVSSNLPTQTFQWFYIVNTKVIKEPVVSHKKMKFDSKCTWTVVWYVCGRTCASEVFMSKARSQQWSCSDLWWYLVGTLQFLMGKGVGPGKQKYICQVLGQSKGMCITRFGPRPPEDRCFPLFDRTLKRTGCSYLTALIIGKDLW